MGTLDLKASLGHEKSKRSCNGNESDKSTDDHKVQYYDEEYDTIIKIAFAENPMGTKEVKKRVALKGTCWRSSNAFKKYKGEVCHFLKDFQIDFDNNQAKEICA